MAERLSGKPLWYTLDENRNAVPTDDINLWKIIPVEQGDYIDPEGKEIYISTTFLGLDHSHAITGPPILYETMIFGGKYDETQWRYSTWEEASLGHKAAVLLVQGKAILE